MSAFKKGAINQYIKYFLNTELLKFIFVVYPTNYFEHKKLKIYIAYFEKLCKVYELPLKTRKINYSVY